MILENFQLFSMLTKRMAWLGKRQQVLAQNIANADTPKYVPKDLPQIDFRRMAATAAGRIGIATTNPRHLVGTRAINAEFKPEPAEQSHELKPDGNAVSLEDQLMKVSQTVMEYQVMTSLYRKHVSMIKMALGRRG